MSEKTFFGAFESAVSSFEIARGQNGKKPSPEIAGRDLADILLSRQLTMDQQWFLARFFLGDIHRHRKPGQPKITSSSDIVQAVARHYVARRAEKHKKTAIYREIEERFGVKRSTILAYLKMVGKENWHDGEASPSLVRHCQNEVSEWERSK